MTIYRLVLTTVGVGALTIAGLGCGGGGGISIDDLPDELSGSLCEAQVACGTYPDVATCEAAIGFFNGEQAQAGVDAGRASYDADKAQACVDALVGTISCEPFSDFENGEEDNIDVCDEVFTGNVALGGECYDDTECAGLTDECEQDCGAEQCCAGTCVAGQPDLAPGAVGAACVDGECVAAGWCSDGTCLALGGEGADCMGFSGCGAGLACDGIQGPGKCVRPAAEGATCDPDQGFGFLSCARGDNYCDNADMTCKKKPVVGEACDVEIKRCVDYAACENATCVARPGAGEACVVDGNVSCLGDLECVNSVCTAEAAPPVCGPAA